MKYNVAVVGAGYWGKNHIKTLFNLGHLHSIIDNRDDVLDSFKKLYPDVNFYRKINEVPFAKIDGFVVSTPADTHYKISKQILKAKKHVLVEKPLCLKIEHAEELVRLSKKNNVNLMVGHLLLFHPAIKMIKKIIQSNKLGKINYIYSHRLNFGKVRKNEDVFMSLAPHDLSIFRHLIDSSIKSFEVKHSKIINKKIADFTVSNFVYKNNTKGHILNSWINPFKEHKLVVIGSKSMLSYEDSSDNKDLLFYDKKFDITKNPIENDGPVKKINYKQSSPLENQLQYFCKHLNGDKIKISNADDALFITRLLLKDY